MNGPQRLLEGAQKHRMALLCSEENPVECHRSLLVGHVLLDHGIELVHIRGDGRLQSQADLERETYTSDARQQLLFDELKETRWKSIRSVSPKPGQPNSSAS